MQMIKVGKITNTHGIKGELKVQTTGIESFDRDISYYIGDNFKEVLISKSRISKKFFIVKLRDYDNINDVLQFKGKDIYINEDDQLELSDDEYYVKDLIGLSVYEDDNLIGELVDVLEYEVNDVYVIKIQDKQVLVPAVEQFVLNIDIKNNRLDVKLIEGM